MCLLSQTTVNVIKNIGPVVVRGPKLNSHGQKLLHTI
jgi:hypothetical protein